MLTCGLAGEAGCWQSAATMQQRPNCSTKASAGAVWAAAGIAVAAASTMTAAAQTAPVDALFEQFGLFGIWAADCQQPASPANPHVSITTPSPGLVSESHDLGPN